MSGTIDPAWGVPVIGVIIAAAAYVWARVTDRAFTRRYGPDPSTVATPQPAVRPSRTTPPSRH